MINHLARHFTPFKSVLIDPEEEKLVRPIEDEHAAAMHSIMYALLYCFDLQYSIFRVHNSIANYSFSPVSRLLAGCSCATRHNAKHVPLHTKLRGHRFSPAPAIFRE